MGIYGAVYKAILWCGLRVCVKLFLKRVLIEEIIHEGILLTLLNTSCATAWCYGIVAVHESNDFHPFGLVQEVIECGLKGQYTLTLKELLYTENDGEKCPAPNWSDLETKLWHGLKSVHRCDVEICDISLKNIMLRWIGECYMPIFIDMGQAKCSNDPNYQPAKDRKKLKKIFKKYFPKFCCVFV